MQNISSKIWHNFLRGIWHTRDAYRETEQGASEETNEHMASVFAAKQIDSAGSASSQPGLPSPFGTSGPLTPRSSSSRSESEKHRYERTASSVTSGSN